MAERFSGEWRKSTIGEEYTIIMGQSPLSSSYNDMKRGIPLVQGNADIVDRVTAPKRYTSHQQKFVKQELLFCQ